MFESYFSSNGCERLKMGLTWAVGAICFLSSLVVAVGRFGGWESGSMGYFQGNSYLWDKVLMELNFRIVKDVLRRHRARFIELAKPYSLLYFTLS